MSAASGRVVYAVVRCGVGESIDVSTPAKAVYLTGKLENASCAAVAIGETLTAQDIDLLSSTGIDNIYHLYLCGSGPIQEAAAAAEITAIAQREHPEIILFASDIWGRSVAPQAAVMLKTGLTADCTELDIDSRGQLVQIRPAFGSSLIAEIICEKRRPQMSSLRRNFSCKPVTLHNKEVPVRVFHCQTAGLDGIRLIEKQIFSETHHKRLAEAGIILSGGLGLGSKEAFLRLKKLADKMHAVIGATRAAVNAGYADYIHQIGQTGITVRPKLYIAFGISGAVQHIMGMSMSETVIAVNNDPKSPIFDVADYAIVEDCNKIIDQMLNFR